MLCISASKPALNPLASLSFCRNNRASSPASTRRREAKFLERLEIFVPTSPSFAFNVNRRFRFGIVMFRITESIPPANRKTKIQKSAQNSRVFPALVTKCVLMLKVFLAVHPQQSDLVITNRPSPTLSLKSPTKREPNHSEGGEKRVALNPLAGTSKAPGGFSVFPPTAQVGAEVQMLVDDDSEGSVVEEELEPL